MAGQRHRPIWIAVIALAVVWLLSWAGYVIAGKTRITPDAVRAYASSLDLNKLSAANRARALRELADKYNALTFDERRGLRPDANLFAQLTEEEEAAFIEGHHAHRNQTGPDRLRPHARRPTATPHLITRSKTFARTGTTATAATVARRQFSPRREAKIRSAPG